MHAQCFFDTPGLRLNCSGKPYKDIRVRVESAWSSVELYDVVIVIFDVHRHLTRLVIVHNYFPFLYFCYVYLMKSILSSIS